MLNTRVLGVIASVLIALIVGLVAPFEGLPQQGHWILATVIVTLGFWIFRPGGLPFMAGGSLLLAGCLIFGLKYNVVAAGFISPAVLGAHSRPLFRLCPAKDGARETHRLPGAEELRAQLAFHGRELVHHRHRPVGPHSVHHRPHRHCHAHCRQVVEACKQAPHSKGSAFITIVAWAMCLFPGTGWLTGSLTGPIMLGFLPAELKGMATFDAWFQILALPWMLITVIFIVLIYITMRPKEAIGIPRDTFRAQYAALGPVTRDEKVALAILIGSLSCSRRKKCTGSRQRP